MSRKDLEKFEGLLNNHNVRKALDIIATSERADYNTTFGGGTFEGYAKHPNIQKRFKQKDGKWNSSGAAGRYQFLKSTWDDLQTEYGFRDFSPRNQDLGAIALLNKLKGKDGKSALQSAIDGDYQAMVEKAGKTWASFPSAPASYSQPKHGWNKMNKIIASATGSPVPDYVDQTGGAEQNYAVRYNDGGQFYNPVTSVMNDDGYQNLQGELFRFDGNQDSKQHDNRLEQPVSPNQVAAVEQTDFIDIPAVYDQAIEDTFGEGSGQQELFSKEIETALRGVFDVA